MTRVLRVVAVTPAHPSRQEYGWSTKKSTLHIAIDLGLKTEKLGIIEMTEMEANEFIDKIVTATGHVRRANR